MKRISWLSMIWVLAFVALPLFYILLLSFQNKGMYGGVEWTWTLENYRQIFESRSILIITRTGIMALSTGLFCTVLGGFCASLICRGSRDRRGFWLSLFLVPFFINSLIRLFSLRNFIGVEGPLQGFLKFVGFSFNGFTWSHNTWVMYIGLIVTYLPFAILPLVGVFERWDHSLTEASQDLGANPVQTFRLVKWPLLKGAFGGAFFMVMIPCLGEYLAPEILEGARNLYWGQYITEAFLKWRNWPLGSALGVVLLILILILRKGSQWLQKS